MNQEVVPTEGGRVRACEEADNSKSFAWIPDTGLAVTFAPELDVKVPQVDLTSSLSVGQVHDLDTHQTHAKSGELGGRSRVRILRDVIQHLLNTPLLDCRINLLRHDVHPPRLTRRRHQTWGGSLRSYRRARVDGQDRSVCWDKTVAESFFATLKNEIYHRHRFTTKARARFAVADYIKVFYNRKRMHSTLGYRTPTQALNDYRSAAAAA